MGWLIFLVYLVGAVLSGRSFYVIGFENDYEDNVKNHRYMSENEKIKYARENGFVTGAFGGALWPIAWPILGFLAFISRPTPTEIKKMEEEKRKEFNLKVDDETVRLRNWLRANKLDVPDPETLRRMAEENVRGASDK